MDIPSRCIVLSSYKLLNIFINYVLVIYLLLNKLINYSVI